MVNYNNFAQTFSNSRINMKWEEIDYFISFIKNISLSNVDILDVWCWNWRLYSELLKSNLKLWSYTWVDLSEWLLNEALKQFPNTNFLNLNMLNLDNLEQKFDIIFFIASFHHLDNFDDRLLVLQKAYNRLKSWWYIFMTNWYLNSNLNSVKYKDSIISWTKNQFDSIDFNIKIGDYTRFYHSFDISELDYLFKTARYEILENRVFENDKNIISIIKKK